MDPFLLPRFAKNPPKASDFKAPFFDTSPTSIAVLENQVQQLVPMVDETDTTESFWIKVHNIKVGDEYKFRPLSTGVIKLLCLPLSNAEVERTFSVTKYFKGIRRTRIATPRLAAMLYCKFGLKRLGQKPSEFIVPRKLFSYSPKILRE